MSVTMPLRGAWAPLRFPEKVSTCQRAYGPVLRQSPSFCQEVLLYLSPELPQSFSVATAEQTAYPKFYRLPNLSGSATEVMLA